MVLVAHINDWWYMPWSMNQCPGYLEPVLVNYLLSGFCYSIHCVYGTFQQSPPSHIQPLSPHHWPASGGRNLFGLLGARRTYSWCSHSMCLLKLTVMSFAHRTSSLSMNLFMIFVRNIQICSTRCPIIHSTRVSQTVSAECTADSSSSQAILWWCQV
jgi:hypothetical protein